jgi:hypothetical protein
VIFRKAPSQRNGAPGSQSAEASVQDGFRF